MIDRVYNMTGKEFLKLMLEFYDVGTDFKENTCYLSIKDSTKRDLFVLINRIHVKSSIITFLIQKEPYESNFKIDDYKITKVKIRYIQVTEQWVIEYEYFKLRITIPIDFIENKMHESNKKSQKEMDLGKVKYTSQLFEEIIVHVLANKNTKPETELCQIHHLDLLYNVSDKTLKKWILNQYKPRDNTHYNLGVSAHHMISDFSCLEFLNPQKIALNADNIPSGFDELFFLWYRKGIKPFGVLVKQMYKTLNGGGKYHLFTVGSNHFIELKQLLKQFDARLSLTHHEEFNSSMIKSLNYWFRETRVEHIHQTLFITDIETIEYCIKKNIDPLSLEVLKKENKYNTFIKTLEKRIMYEGGIKLNYHIICLYGIKPD